MDKKLRWDVVALIDDLGGSHRVRELCVRQGYAVPPYRTIQNWRQRDNAPGHGLALLLNLGWQTYEGFDYRSYLKEAE